MGERFSPFARPVVPNELTADHPRIKEISESGYLVREYSLSLDPKLNVQLLDWYKGGIETWRKLGTYEGIALPGFSVLMGIGMHGQPSLLIPTEKIKGQNLEEILLADAQIPAAKDSFEALITGLCQHARDLFYDRGEYFYDQRLSQYVYGENSAGKRGTYFVDFGMETYKLTKERREGEDSKFIAGYMITILQIIEGLEKKVHGPLLRGKEAFAKFLSDIPEESEGSGYARSVVNLFRPQMVHSHS